MAPKKPLPMGRASSHIFDGLLYQSCIGLLLAWPFVELKKLLSNKKQTNKMICLFIKKLLNICESGKLKNLDLSMLKITNFKQQYSNAKS